MPRYLKINKVKKELDALADTRATRAMWMGGFYLIAQFGILARYCTLRLVSVVSGSSSL